MPIEIIQTGLTLIGVAGIGGVWFRLGEALGRVEHVEHRLEQIENHIWKGV